MKRTILVALGVLLLVVTGMGLWIGRWGLDLKRQALVVRTSIQVIPELLRGQKMQELGGQVVKIKTDLTGLQNLYDRGRWLSWVPVLNWYYQDGLGALATAQELLTVGTIVSGTADFQFTIQQWQQIAQALTQARTTVASVSTGKYPRAISNYLTAAQNVLGQLTNMADKAQEAPDLVNQVLGMTQSRKYLILFQNDAELRPTGGFITAYATVTVEKGEIEIDFSDNIYDLDAKLKDRLPAPEAIQKYLPNVPYWHLRDRNLSPDLVTSLGWFYPDYLKLQGTPVDGIITVDTQVFVDLLRVTGPVYVPDVGRLTAETDKRCGCPQAFYELELRADAETPTVIDDQNNQNDRKAFIGPAMNQIMHAVTSLPPSQALDLFNTIMLALQGKHVQVYFLDARLQQVMEQLNFAGRVKDYTGDYLLVVDTNFAGGKTNVWVQYNAKQKIAIDKTGTIIKTLELTYRNPQHDFQDPKTKLRLNGVFRNWLRVYVPKGSQLLEAKGFEAGRQESEDLGKTVFEGFFTLNPLASRVITLKYQLPFKATSPYRLLIQKQAGSKAFTYETSINGWVKNKTILGRDQEYALTYP